MPAGKASIKHEQELRRRIRELENRLTEAEETLRAIREGEVDAVVVSGSNGEQIFSLVGADVIYRLIVETMKEAAFTVTCEGTILFSNAQFGDLLERPLQQIIGHPIQDFVAAGEKSAASSLLVTAQEQPVKQRLMFETGNGQPVPTHISATVLHQPEGVSICVVATDLTDLENSVQLIQHLRRQQSALENANEELAAMKEMLQSQNEELCIARDLAEKLARLSAESPTPILRVSSDGKILYANPAAISDDVWHCRDERPPLEIVKLCGEAEANATIWHRDLEICGRKYAVSAKSFPDEGYVNVYGRDITERERAEEQLRQAHHELDQKVRDRTEELHRANTNLRMISECSQALVRMTNEEDLMREVCRIIVEVGGYRMAWVGYAENDPGRTVRPVAIAGAEAGYLDSTRISWGSTGHGWGPTGRSIRSGEIMHCHDFRCDPLLAPWREEALSRGFRSSVALPLKSGGKAFGALTIYSGRPEAFDEAETTSLRGLADDLAYGIAALRTQLERDEARKTSETRAGQLQALAAELMMAEQKERRRLAKVLHDHLQQLLVGAKFGTSVMRAKAKSNDDQQLADQLADTLNEALLLSRSLSADLSPPVLHEKGLAAGLEWLGRQMQERHGLAVTVQADAEAGPAAEQVRLFLFEAARELLLNVVKHAQVDRAHVRLRALDGGAVELTVEDHGIGFDAARRSVARASGGGFGLFSIQERLGYLGGSMTIDAKPGLGSRFTLVAPAFPVSAPTELKPALPEARSFAAAIPVARSVEAVAKTGDKIRVLLADDHTIMRHGLIRLLQEQPDIEVVGEAGDGMAAVALAQQFKPDVVLMDVSMPGMSGFEATRQIMSLSPDIRVVGLSMHEESDMAATMLQAGATAFVTKSGPPEDLIAAIRACQSQKHSSSA